MNPADADHAAHAGHEHFEGELCCMERGRVIDEVRLRQVGRDLWCLLTNHGVGNSRWAPTLPNRMYVFRVQDAQGKACLAVLNAVHADLEADQPFKALRELSREQNAPLRYILNPGPEHHLSLMTYAAAFPDAQICVAGGRIERENPALCTLDNVTVMANGDALPELSRMGLHVHVWGGFMEQSFANRLQFRFRAPLGTAEPTLFWHEASGAFINGGHGWITWAEGDKPLPYPIRRLIKPKQGQVVWSPVHYAVYDEGRAVDGAQRLLDWTFTRVFDLHVGLDRHLKERGRPQVEALLRPLAERNWEALPFPRSKLEIPEGVVTGGDWKSYRAVAARSQA